MSNIPFKVSTLNDVFPELKTIKGKAKRLDDAGEIIRLKKGLYVVSPEVSGGRLNEYLIANHIYGPSYISMQTALRHYGLIPEAVHESVSMTTGLAKIFHNDVGDFKYIHCPTPYYSVGIASENDGNTTFLIATPEKALCDLICNTPNLNLRYSGEILNYLEQDLRMDVDDILKFDTDILRKCAETGKKKAMITQLIKIIENGRNI